MALVYLLELIFLSLVLYFVVTQVIMPLWRDTPLFPMFRRENRLQHKLAEANEEVVEAELEKKIAETAQRAKSVRQTVGRSTRSNPGSGGSVNR